MKEFNFGKGMLTATFSGIMSSCFAYGLAAGKPIADLTRTQLKAHGGSDLWQNLYARLRGQFKEGLVLKLLTAGQPHQVPRALRGVAEAG